MGFGAYDESEQENQDPHATDIETGEERDGDHNGEVKVEGADDTDELLEKLNDIKS